MRAVSSRPIALAAIALAVSSSLAACGVDTGSETFREIPPNEIPFDLGATSTVTSTTTTTVPDEVPTTEAQPTTSVAPVEPVTVYFVSRDELQPVPAALSVGFGPNQLTELLEAGPPDGAAGVGLDSFIEAGLIDPGEPRDAAIEIDLDEELYDQIDSEAQTAAIAQIVLTFTQNLPTVGLVTFTLSGEPLQVTKGNGLLSEEGETLSFDDFANLLGGAGTTATTTSTVDAPPSGTTTTIG
jgi:hypothetical protein